MPETARHKTHLQWCEVRKRGVMALGWFCVNTQARSEDIAVRHLTRRGFTVLFPQYAHPRTHRMHPLFPNYLFLQFDPDAVTWQIIYSTPGVKLLFMRSPGTPLEIPQDFIDLIQGQVQQAQRAFAAPAPAFQTNDVVQVDDPASPFYSLQGICQQVTADRVSILVKILGRMTEIQFHKKDLVRIA